LAISVGVLTRSIPGDIPLFAGTVLLGLGIAAGTVLIPAAIVSDVPALRSGLIGTYSMSLSLGPALALGATIPMMRFTGLDSRGTLTIWAGCGLVALVLWMSYTRDMRHRLTHQSSSDTTDELTSTTGPIPLTTGSLPITTGPLPIIPAKGMRSALRDGTV